MKNIIVSQCANNKEDRKTSSLRERQRQGKTGRQGDRERQGETEKDRHSHTGQCGKSHGAEKDPCCKTLELKYGRLSFQDRTVLMRRTETVKTHLSSGLCPTPSSVSGTHPRDRRATSLSISIKHISVIWREWQRTSPPCDMTEADFQ
jgi:hypothetical protein